MERIRWIVFAVNIFLTGNIIFKQKKETESTWAWILLLLNFPVCGLLLYLLTGQSIPGKKAEKAQENTAGLTEDNRVEILTSGEEKFQAVFGDMKQAKKEIWIQYYIFKDDFLFRKMEEILAKKAAEGVDVRILYDGLGSRKIRKRVWSRLERKGIRIKRFRHGFLGKIWNGFNYRNHRKIVVIDRYIGYMGGYNIGKEYLGLEPKFGHWRDTHFRMTGSAVQSLRNIFLEDWGESKIQHMVKGGKGGSVIQIAASGPDSGQPHIRNIYLRCIMSARSRIWIQSPYFVPDAPMLTALKLALLAGKEVKIMIPCKPDHFFVYWASLFYAAQLLEMGAQVYIYQNGFLHAKGLIMDQEAYCYGTANMDIRSFHLNYEINAIIYGREETEKMCEIYERDLNFCKQLTWQEYSSRKPTIRIKEQLSRLLSPLL